MGNWKILKQKNRSNVFYFFFLGICDIFYIVIFMDESRRNRVLLVVIIVIMLLVIIIGGILLHINKEEKKSLLKLKQLYVSDYKIVPFDKYFMGVNDNKIISIIDENGKELYLNDNGVKYDGLFMKNDDTPIIYNVLNDLHKQKIRVTYKPTWV